MKTILIGIAMLCVCRAAAQINENFSDGNFTVNPPWTGSSTDWSVNAQLQLQSNNTTPNSSFYLSTANTLATAAQWDFFCNLAFNPSSANYADVFLAASANDLMQNNTTGYFVRIGNSNDEICLYRKDAGGAVKIIDGADGVLNNSNNVMRIRVTRNASNAWTLSRDLSGTGNSYTTEGTVTDNTYNSSSFFGILIKQSTSSFFQKHFFDDMVVQPYVPDITPPQIISATAISSTNADVLFNEVVDQLSAEIILNYSLGNIGSPLTAQRDAVNNSLVHLTFSSLPPRVPLTLNINGVKDLAGNSLINGSTVLYYYTPQPFDLVIDEIMADPSPQVQLPNNEWVELKNTTNMPVNLQGWRLGKSTGESGPMPSYILKPDSFVAVCTGSAVAAMNVYGPVISVTAFPSLSNDADLVYLRAQQGMIVHAVSYTDDWYKNELKKEGGWSLEMIDTHNPCTGADNWKASTNEYGGTPARKNSVDAVNPDNKPPKLLRAFVPDSLHIILVFDEPLDSLSAAHPSAYAISDGIGNATNALPLSFSFDHVLLQLSTALSRNKIYTVTVAGVNDCSGNAVGMSHTARAGLYEPIDSLSIVVNEVLFNPKPAGTDYAEFYNRSKKILNLKNALIANRNSTGIISSVTRFTNEDYLFFPGDYMVVTADPVLVQRNYFSPDPSAFLRLSSMPSFNDDAGDVVLLNEQGMIIDELAYSEKWHFPLITEPEGVALERINPDAETVQKNFHSAATDVGYGTPGYKNSQYHSDEEVTGIIKITPGIISPDNDGRDDFATVQYEFPEPGYVANITIFDASGRPVRYLEQSALCGIKGFYRWDGLEEKQQRLASGIYIIYTEVFNLKGKMKKFKNVIVVAGS